MPVLKYYASFFLIMLVESVLQKLKHQRILLEKANL